MEHYIISSGLKEMIEGTRMAREGAFREDDRVLFLHSGGAGGLFAVGV